MNIDVHALLPLLRKIARWLKRYFGILLFVSVSMLYGFLIFKINAYNRQQPDPAAISQRIEQVKRPRIDQQTAEKLQNLEDSSKEVQALFQEARDNPFIE